MIFILYLTELEVMEYLIMSGEKNYKNKGFTVVELLVVLSIIALLLSVITPRYLNKIEEGREVALKQNLSMMRRSIDQYYSDQGVYPDKLNQLIEKRYLREIPKDPISQSYEWTIINDKEQGGIYDVKSISQEVASDKRMYSEW
jgi:general secretion pathway protein G